MKDKKVRVLDINNAAVELANFRYDNCRRGALKESISGTEIHSSIVLPFTLC